jgi:hypothetical protein
VDEKTINVATKAKEDALKLVHSRTEDVYAQKAELETVTVYFTNLGLEGSNESTRRADLATKTEQERTDLATAEKALRNARLDLDLANNELERIRLILKLEESVGTPA